MTGSIMRPMEKKTRMGRIIITPGTAGRKAPVGRKSWFKCADSSFAMPF